MAKQSNLTTPTSLPDFMYNVGDRIDLLKRVLKVLDNPDKQFKLFIFVVLMVKVQRQQRLWQSFVNLTTGLVHSLVLLLERYTMVFNETSVIFPRRSLTVKWLRFNT